MSRKLTYPAVLPDMMQFVMSTEPPLMKKPPPCESRKVLTFLSVHGKFVHQGRVLKGVSRKVLGQVAYKLLSPGR